MAAIRTKNNTFINPCAYSTYPVLFFMMNKWLFHWKEVMSSHSAGGDLQVLVTAIIL
ncbi:Uncharacterised protein [Actinobacillus pleuropneumoniae]|nr:Uncharacterised protein [Actinobacillus pleuropneumoniae]